MKPIDKELVEYAFQYLDFDSAVDFLINQSLTEIKFNLKWVNWEYKSSEHLNDMRNSNVLATHFGIDINKITLADFKIKYADYKDIFN